MFSNIFLLGLLSLQLAVPSSAFVPRASTRRGVGVYTYVAEDTTTSLMAKKILCSFDSSFNGEIVSNPRYNDESSYTNVLRLHVLAGGSLDLTKNTGVDGSDQICLYVNGIAGDTTVPEMWKKAQGFLGYEKFQIKSMRDKLESVYEKDDEICIIGFSRGSASARNFVAELDKGGLVTANGETVDKPPIKFLGCFDTVADQVVTDLPEILLDAELGRIPRSEQVGEVDGQLPGIVEKAVHNLSLDDRRFRSFRPLKNNPYPPVYMDSKNERVHEVWFPGTHTDVGGSCATHGLSDCAGKYMQEWLENEGIVFYEPDEIPSDRFEIPEGIEGRDKVVPVTAEDIAFNPNPADKDHPTDTDFPRPCATVHDNKIFTDGTVRIHESVLEHLKQYDGYKITPNIKNINNANGDFVVVGSLDQPNQEKTKELKNLLEKMDL